MAKRPKKPPKMWVFSPPKPPKPKVPDDLKAEVTAQAEALIQELKPIHIKEPPKDYLWNYVDDLYGKWFRSYFYFCARYACPDPRALAPSFEIRFARMEYVGNQRFSLSYMRHTGEWIELEQDLTIEKCLRAIKDDPYYIP